MPATERATPAESVGVKLPRRRRDQVEEVQMRMDEVIDPDVGPRGAADGRDQVGEGRDQGRTRAAPISRRGMSVLAVAHDGAKLDNLVRTLRASTRIGEVDTAVSAHRALLSASRRAYDGVFLDVGMPEFDGIEIVSVLNAFALPPGVVVVAESDTQVARAFKLGAVDYVIAPVTSERAEEALQRLEDAAARRQPGEDRRGIRPSVGDEAHGGNVLVIDNGRDGTTRLVGPRSILYLQAYGDYIRVFADSGRYLIRGRLTDAAMTLDADGFLRVHRKYLANLRRATGLQMLQNGTALLRLEHERQVPVARRHVHELRQRLGTDLRSLGMTWRTATPVDGDIAYLGPAGRPHRSSYRSPRTSGRSSMKVGRTSQRSGAAHNDR
jgi:DNA-binding LytR/AlgR family response regulator